MLIVHVVRQFYPGIGGLEGVVLELAKAQIVSGHTVRVVTLDRLFKESNGTILPHRETVCGIDVVRVSFLGSPRYPIAFTAIKHFSDADIVHVHGVDFFTDYLALTKPIHRKKLVVSTHGGYFHTRFAKRFKTLYFYTVTRFVLTCYSSVVAISAADYARFGTIRRRGMVCIENGIDKVQYCNAASPTPTKSILAIGRFATHKRLDLLILFVAALRRRDPQWTLKVVGRPWDLSVQDVISMAKNVGMRQGLQVIASASAAELRKLMADCSFIATASEYEGFGLAAVEGMSAGLIPLLSNIPPFRRLLEQTRVGLLLDFSDVEAAANLFFEKWAEFTSNYPAYRSVLMSAVSDYGWSRVAQQYQQLYDGVTGNKTRLILDVPIYVSTLSKAAEYLDSRFNTGELAIVSFANANTLNFASVDPRFRKSLQNSLVFNDGIGVDIASTLLFGAPFPDNLNGTDFISKYLATTRNRYRIFLLGAKPGVAERAAKSLVRYDSQHTIVGWRDGYFADSDLPQIIEAIQASKADILLAALGNPKQELWLTENLAATGCRLGLGVGALFDFLSGDMPRAPAWIRFLRFEWAYRFWREPRRLWRRYLIGNTVFMARIAGQWWSGQRV